MKRIVRLILFAGLAFAVTSCATRNAALNTGNQSVSLASTGIEPGWPLNVVNGTYTSTVYQPEIDSWDGHTMTARSAVAIQPSGENRPIYGVIAITAITLVNKQSRTVTLADLQVVGGQFPSAPQRAQYYQKMLGAAFPKEVHGFSLDHLEASLALSPQQFSGSGPALNNTPPNIVFSSQSALLVSIDGPPAYRPVRGTDLERVINCRLLLLKNPAGQYYLHLWDGYLTSSALAGPWRVADHPPQGASKAESEAVASKSVDLMEGPLAGQTSGGSSLTAATAPVIYVETKPSELILFNGQPDFVPISGTHLLYAANTTGNVFTLLTDQRNYVLISGRWYSAPSLSGPWQFVPPNQLPSDFADIPDTSAKENVKASVPGTSQASEALIANSIPDSTEVPRTTQMQDPHIDGSPQLQPVAGTPLYYVVNSGTPILRVDDHSWYACQNGVWYDATSVNGPWAVAASVPAIIYSIPVSSPLHYLTYVQVYGATPQYVYEGYTPGYLGTEVQDGVVVYGTGYWYPPWVGDVWFCGPMTWGCGWDFCWTPWNDWCYGFGFGWGCGPGFYGWNYCHPPGPFWGGFRHWHDRGAGFAQRGRGEVTTAANVFAHSGAQGAFGHGGLNRAGWTAGYGQAYNSRTGALASGQRAGVQNVYASRVGHGGFPQNWQNRGSLSPAARSMSANTWLRGGAFGAPYASRSAYSYHGYGGFGGAYSHSYGGFSHEGAGAFHGGWGGGGYHGGGLSGGFHGGGFGGGFHGGGFGGGGGHGGGGGGHR